MSAVTFHIPPRFIPRGNKLELWRFYEVAPHIAGLAGRADRRLWRHQAYHNI